jgi:nuclear pore complex protein Nup93
MQLICAIATSRYILAVHILYVLFCINPILLSFEIQLVEIHKRVGAFSMALQTINKCLSDAVCAMAHSMLDGESRAAALIQSGMAMRSWRRPDILQKPGYFSLLLMKIGCFLCCLKVCNFSFGNFPYSVQDKDLISEQQIVLRQLEAILHIYRVARVGQTVDALREIIRLPFLHLDPKAPNLIVDIFRNLSPHVQACVPDFLKVALNCIDNVRDTDGTLHAIKSKVFHHFPGLSAHCVGTLT